MVISGIAASALLLSPPTPLLLGIFAAVYGAAFSAVVSIGPWLAELYPPELRTAATSMFQWGRFISLLGTSRDWKCRRLLGLRGAMGLPVMAFARAAAIWSRLPETLVRHHVLNRARLYGDGSM